MLNLKGKNICQLQYNKMVLIENRFIDPVTIVSPHIVCWANTTAMKHRTGSCWKCVKFRKPIELVESATDMNGNAISTISHPNID